MPSLLFNVPTPPAPFTTVPALVHLDGSSAGASWLVMNFKRNSSDVTTSAELSWSAPLVAVKLSNSEFDGLCNAIHAGGALILTVVYTASTHGGIVQSVTAQAAQAVA